MKRPLVLTAEETASALGITTREILGPLGAEFKNLKDRWSQPGLDEIPPVGKCIPNPPAKILKRPRWRSPIDANSTGIITPG